MWATTDAVVRVPKRGIGACASHQPNQSDQLTPFETQTVNLIIVKNLAYSLVPPLVINAIATLDLFTVGVAAFEPTPRRIDTRPSSSNKGDRLLNSIFLVGSMSLAITFLVLALVREMRLRRGLQQLLVKLLARWRKHDATNHMSE